MKQNQRMSFDMPQINAIIYLSSVISDTFLFFQESDSEVEDSLDDLEKHLREKALRSMRKAQLSPSQMS